MILLLTLIKLFVMGFIIYLGIEVTWDGNTDRRMGVLGGVALTIAYFIPHTILGGIALSVIIVLLELIAGLMWNRDYRIWDYRNMWLNYKGQICLLFYFIWLALTPFVFWLVSIIT